MTADHRADAPGVFSATDPDRDYSQFGEQAIILEHFAGRRERFLELGAYDGVTASNTRALALRDWYGVCVEAAPGPAHELAYAYRDNPNVEVLNAAVSAAPPALRRFSYVGLQALGSLDAEHVVPVKRIDTHTVTPQMILERYGWVWPFVTIDLEGSETLAVLMNLWQLGGLAGTELVCVEAAADSFTLHGFEPIAESYVNTILRRTLTSS